MILSKIAKFLLGESAPTFMPQANGWYVALGNMARDPRFYTKLAVPDTINGRYDMLCVLLCLLHVRLQQLEEVQLNQALFDIAFAHLEQQLRQAGVSDLAIPRQMKKHIQAFYGRLEAYAAALEVPDQMAYAAVVARNIFADIDEADDKALALTLAIWPWWENLAIWLPEEDLPEF